MPIRILLLSINFKVSHFQSLQEGNEPLVSAALDFKAMLEAALLSPYKFCMLNFPFFYLFIFICFAKRNSPVQSTETLQVSTLKFCTCMAFVFWWSKHWSGTQWAQNTSLPCLDIPHPTLIQFAVYDSKPSFCSIVASTYWILSDYWL